MLVHTIRYFSFMLQKHWIGEWVLICIVLLQALLEKWRNNAAFQSVLCRWGTVASPAGFILINNRNSSINHWHYCFMYLWSTSAHSSFHTVMQDSNLVTQFPSISCWTEACHSPELLAKHFRSWYWGVRLQGRAVDPRTPISILYIDCIVT